MGGLRRFRVVVVGVLATLTAVVGAQAAQAAAAVPECGLPSWHTIKTGPTVTSAPYSLYARLQAQVDPRFGNESGPTTSVPWRR